MIHYRSLILFFTLAVVVHCPLNEGICDDVAESQKVHPVSLRRWYLQIQKVGGQFDTGENSVQTELNKEAMMDAIEKEIVGTGIEYKTRIKSVTWNDGVASIRTMPEFEQTKGVHIVVPVLLEKSFPIEVLMSQEEAAEVKPGQWLEFRAALQFDRGSSYSIVMSKKEAQQLYRVHHYRLGSYFGLIFTDQYEVWIDRKRVKGRWELKEL